MIHQNVYSFALEHLRTIVYSFFSGFFWRFGTFINKEDQNKKDKWNDWERNKITLLSRSSFLFSSILFFILIWVWKFFELSWSWTTFANTFQKKIFFIRGYACSCFHNKMITWLIFTKLALLRSLVVKLPLTYITFQLENSYSFELSNK